MFLKEAEHVSESTWDLKLVKEIGINSYIFNILVLVLDRESQVLIRHSCDGNGMVAWKTLCERFDGSMETRTLDLRMKLQTSRWKHD